MHRTAGQRVVEHGEPDQRGFIAIGVEHVDATVGDQDAGDRIPGHAPQALEDFGDQVGGRGLGPPWCSDDLESRPNLMDTGPVEHNDVIRAFGGEQRAGVYR